MNISLNFFLLLHCYFGVLIVCFCSSFINIDTVLKVMAKIGVCGLCSRNLKSHGITSWNVTYMWLGTFFGKSRKRLSYSPTNILFEVSHVTTGHLWYGNGFYPVLVSCYIIVLCFILLKTILISP